jgi:2-polyprenyl-3-methyl-5-hydroxy-6-metoxy-1,4-benzoquinol methylase
MKVKIENVLCPNGCSAADKHILTSRDYLHDLRGEYSLVECETCGLVRTNPRPTAETIGYYYPEDYGPYQTNKTIKDPTFLNKLFSKFKFYGFKFPNTPGTLLEIGSGSGDFLINMKEKGWNVEGLEFSDKAAQRAINHGIKMRVGTLESEEFRGEVFDVIYGWMVLEHLHEPLESLKKLRQLTHQDSRLYFAVPNIRSMDFLIFKRYWFPLQLPSHLTHFTKNSFLKMALSAGFELEKVHYFRGMKDFFASLSNLLKDKNMKRMSKFVMRISAKSNTILYPIGYVLSVFGLSSRMVFVLKVKI